MTREHNQRNQNVFTEPMDVLADRQSLILGDRLETVASHDACQLAGRSIGTDHGDVAQIWPPRDNAQVRATILQYLAGIGAPNRSGARPAISVGCARSKNAVARSADPAAKAYRRTARDADGSGRSEGGKCKTDARCIPLPPDDAAIGRLTQKWPRPARDDRAAAVPLALRNPPLASAGLDHGRAIHYD